jgi:LysR family transcriptional regulator, transcriptional activator of nhaA
MFNYNHLFYFYTTARLNGVTNAARALKVAQPSLSIQLKTLEEKLQRTLFEKVGRRLQLTPDGERVFEYCQKIFAAAEDLEDYLKDSSGEEVKRCRIGIAPEIERPFVADVLSSLLHKNKLSERPFLSMMTSEHKELITRLTQGEIDVVVTNHSVHAPNVKLLAQLSMPVVAVANLKRMKSLSSSISLGKMLKKEMPDLILPSDSLKLRLESDMFLQKHKIRNPVVFESDILSMIVRAVLEGVGIGFLPEHYIQKELSQKNLTALHHGHSLWETKLYVFTRTKKVDDPTVQQIKSHFLALGAKA